MINIIILNLIGIIYEFKIDKTNNYNITNICNYINTKIIDTLQLRETFIIIIDEYKYNYLDDPIEQFIDYLNNKLLNSNSKNDIILTVIIKEYYDEKNRTLIDYKKNIINLSDNWCTHTINNEHQFIFMLQQKPFHSLFSFGHTDLRNKLEIIEIALKVNGLNLRYLTEEQKDNRKLVLIAIKSDGRALKFASNNMRKDKEIVLTAINTGSNDKNHHATDLCNTRDSEDCILQYVDIELRNDRYIILTAVSKNGNNLKYAIGNFYGDKEIMLSAVSTNGSLLFKATEQLKNDKQVVKAALSNNGLAIQCISKELKADETIVMLAMKQNYSAFYYADPILYKNDCFMVEAMKIKELCIKDANDNVEIDSE